MPITSRTKSDPLKRLARISGHLDAVVRMVDDERYCVDVIHQIKAVQAALDKVSEQLLRNHLNTCVVAAIQSQDEERVLDELMAIFKKAPQLFTDSDELSEAATPQATPQAKPTSRMHTPHRQAPSIESGCCGS